jgi:GGDEF domain-containing protein
MLSFGCDDYIVTPVKSGELAQIFGGPPLRIAEGEDSADALTTSPPTKLSLLPAISLADLLLDTILQHPQGGAAAAMEKINDRLAPAMQLVYLAKDALPPTAPEGSLVLTHPIRIEADEIANLAMTLPRDEEQSAARHLLAQIALLIGKLAAVEDRHVKMQKLAITDDLTGLYNSRYFRTFLSAILKRAKQQKFLVQLLLFDIDHFKSYNDQYGHGVGDEILKETASLMKRCVRDHDFVARLGGDEFAVVFWEKEGRRTPHGPAPATSAHIPQTPLQIFERFRRLARSPDFASLGSTGKGTLTISGGMATYPFDAQTPEDLIHAADEAMMFKAKQQGKDTIFLVGDQEAGEEREAE